MGSNHSKSSPTSSLKNEKHNSADSKTPLTKPVRADSLDIHESLDRDGNRFDSRRPPAVEKDDIQPLPGKSTIRMVSSSSSSAGLSAFEGHSDVSRPPPPPRLRHLSELIDPVDLAVDSQVRSPSGTFKCWASEGLGRNAATAPSTLF